LLHTAPGYNERLDGLQAAFLRVKLPHLQAWNESRRAAAARYREGLDGVGLLDERPESPCVYHVFPILVAGREAFREAVRGHGVTTSVHYPATLPDQPALAGITAGEVSAARDWAARELSLPIFPGVSDEELDAVIEAVNAAAIEVGGRCESAT
jgi:dTDP-4-amino-4,6-dideoxygalactose transaminase